MMYIPSLKEETKRKEIKTLSDAPVFHLLLKVKEGKDPGIVVAEGERVLKYQLLAKAGEGLRAPVYSPVSGTITRITGTEPETGQLPNTIYITNDFWETTTNPFPSLEIPLRKEQFLKRIEEAGILGHGGAEFPPAVKYKTEAKINTLIVNGVECEPYLTTDYALMSQRTAPLVEGIELLATMLGAKEVIVAVEKQNREVLSLLTREWSNKEHIRLRTQTVPNSYPEGSELQLIRSLTGKELPKGTIPATYGIMVNNVATIYAIHQAVTTNRPIISRILTVSGEYSNQRGNYEVKLGTPISHVLNETGRLSGGIVHTLKGGAMMGEETDNLASPVSQGTSGVLILPQILIHRFNCIGCGYCVDVCPMSLMPFKYDQCYRSNDWKGLQRYNLNDCITCASCEYICPCNVPLMMSIIEGKKQLSKQTK